APQRCAPGSLIMKCGADRARPRAPYEAVAERLVGLGARDGDAPLPHGIGRAEVGPREQARAPGSAAHARFTRDAAERLEIVAVGGDDTGPRVPVHDPSMRADPRPQHRIPPGPGGAEPRASL